MAKCLFIFSRKRRSTNKSQTTASSTEANHAESNYTDLEDRSRPSSNYTELQTRNDDYSSIEAAGNAYVNTQLKHEVDYQNIIISVMIYNNYAI